MITKDKLLELGFKKQPNFTIMDSYIYDLGRNRELSYSCAESPNEIVFINQLNDYQDKSVDDVVVIHNYDYDGWMTEKKLKSLIFGLTGKKL